MQLDLSGNWSIRRHQVQVLAAITVILSETTTGFSNHQEAWSLSSVQDTPKKWFSVLNSKEGARIYREEEVSLPYYHSVVLFC